MPSSTISDSGREEIYARAAGIYYDLGWHGAIPIDSERRPPIGFTGHDGAFPEPTQIGIWMAEHPMDNIGIRPPHGVIGIDIDAYGEKKGAQTIAALTKELGPLPPTWKSTARMPLDVLSGIYWFRVPEDGEWRDLGEHVETIRHGHRFGIVWPSINSRVNKQYKWYKPNGNEADLPPKPVDLPELPAAWIEKLQKGSTPSEGNRVDVNQVMTGLSEGDRDQKLFEYASRLRAKNIEYEEALVLVCTWAAGCHPPFPEEWAKRKVDQAWRYPAGTSFEIAPQNEQWLQRLKTAGALVTGTGEPELKFMTLGQVRRTYKKPKFLVRQNLLTDAFKFTGGAEKTLKSWTMACEAVSVAAGIPLFGYEPFDVPRAGRVLVITGEGGVDLYLDRADHVCRSLRVNPVSIEDNLLVTDQIMPFDHPGFAGGIKKAIKQFDPVLIQIEPLYIYMGATASQNAGNVYAMGPVLAALRAMAPDRAIHIGHHFNKSGRDNLSLSSMTQAGAREFADHWCLLAHREEPDLERQSFKLNMSVGARRGFGYQRHLDIVLGPLDPDSLTHQGMATFTLSEGASRSDDDEWQIIVYQEIRENPGEFTQNDLINERNGVGLDSPGKRRKALNDLKNLKLVRADKGTGSQGGRRVDRYWPIWDVDVAEAINLSSTKT